MQTTGPRRASCLSLLSARTTSAHHHTWPNYFYFCTKCCCVALAGLELLSSMRPPTPASQSLEIAGLSRHDQPKNFLKLECSSVISAHFNLHLPSSDSPASAS
ncbi:hypothetical protein AAY473_024154, partial [Plecturocebus cupreus]